MDVFKRAFETRDINEFLSLIFPPEWKSISARIIESGATMSSDNCAWAPKWSPIPPTERSGNCDLATHIKSCIFRAHDCIHQLWGLPIPSEGFSEEDFYLYKRSQMCGEVAVLTLTEFALCKSLYERYESSRSILWLRNALPMLEGPLKGRTIKQIAIRLDSLLHKKIRPKWVRDHKESTDFCDDYVPMLEHDRRCIDHNWSLMKKNNWLPHGAPNARYSPYTDGLELTTWMIDDFFHLMDTDPVVDIALASFNQNRRKNIILPLGWNEAK